MKELTVKELIEALQKMPEDYVVRFDNGDTGFPVGAVGIDYEQEKTVLLFS